jgi:hypothetical protein
MLERRNRVSLVEPDHWPVVERSGAVHIHTLKSDGGVDFPDLVETAKTVGLDYVVVTDHMSLHGRASYEGVHGSVVVLVGYEHNDSSNRNHYLALGVDKVVREQDDPQKYIDAVREAGGIGFIAHPFEKRDYFKNLPAYPWTCWSATGYDGIELWNQISDWVEQLRSYSRFIRFFFPRRYLAPIGPELLSKWDTVNRERFVAGIGGVDAHTRRVPLGLFHLTVFPLKVELKGVRTHLYLRADVDSLDEESVKRAYLEGLRDGRGFISNYRWGDARGTKIYVEYADGTVVLPGRTVSAPRLPATLTVSLPRSARINLVGNGVTLESRSNTSNATFAIGSHGVYRIEVFRNKNAWVYSNPFPIGGYPL